LLMEEGRAPSLTHNTTHPKTTQLNTCTYLLHPWTGASSISRRGHRTHGRRGAHAVDGVVLFLALALIALVVVISFIVIAPLVVGSCEHGRRQEGHQEEGAQKTHA